MNPNIIVKNVLDQPTINNTLTLIARAFLSYLFIVAGWGKIGGYAGTASFMESKGLPSSLLIFVIFLELSAGIGILIGFQARVAAFFLSLFCIVSALIFYGSAEDSINFMKNIGLAGGFICILSHGAGGFSIDACIEHQKT